MHLMILAAASAAPTCRVSVSMTQQPTAPVLASRKTAASRSAPTSSAPVTSSARARKFIGTSQCDGLQTARLRSRFFDDLIHCFEAGRNDSGLLRCEFPVLGVNCFTYAGQRLHAVAGIESGGVDLVLIPIPVRQPLRRCEHAFGLDQGMIQGGQPGGIQ